MALSKQAKVLSKHQINSVLRYLEGKRNVLRNKVIFLLSVKGGLRSIEISNLDWKSVLNSDSSMDDFITVTNDQSKGKSGGRVIPLNDILKTHLSDLLIHSQINQSWSPKDFIIHSERGSRMTSQTIVNFFQKLYSEMGLVGCSSHSGRRTFITNCAKMITQVGGSLRDVQYLSGHSSLQTTQRYIEGDSESKRKVVNLI